MPGSESVIIIIIIINLIYRARTCAANMLCRLLCTYSLCHEKCFQPFPKHRQWHVQT